MATKGAKEPLTEKELLLLNRLLVRFSNMVSVEQPGYAPAVVAMVARWVMDWVD